MNPSAASVASLLEDLYASPTRPEAWARFLDRLATECGACRAWLLIPEPPAAAYHRGSARTTSLTPRVPLQNLPSVLWDDTAHPLWPLDAARNLSSLGAASGLALEPTIAPTVTPQTSASDVAELLAMLKPHLQRVARTQRDLSSRSSLTPSVTVLGCFPLLFDIPVISLDAAGAVVEVSPSANIVLRHGGIHLRGSSLIASAPGEDATLRGLLRSATDAHAASIRTASPLTQLQPNPPSTPTLIGAALFSREPLAPLSVTVATVPACITGSTSIAALVFLGDPTQPVSSRASLLRTLYRLSPTEGRLVEELAAGRRLKQAAEALHLTENTARFHLKEVFRKTVVSTQAELMRLVLALPGLDRIPEHHLEHTTYIRRVVCARTVARPAVWSVAETLPAARTARTLPRRALSRAL